MSLRTRKDLQSYYGMDSKPNYLLNSLNECSLDPKDLFEEFKIGDRFFDAYLSSISLNMKLYDSIDPYKKGALKPITDKADSFLMRHSGISFEQFLRKSNPEEFIDEDFGELPKKKNLRRRLFEHRTRLYLSALEDCENLGIDINEILLRVRVGKIPYLKKNSDEPSFKEILKTLKKSY